MTPLGGTRRRGRRGRHNEHRYRGRRRRTRTTCCESRRSNHEKIEDEEVEPRGPSRTGPERSCNAVNEPRTVYCRVRANHRPYDSSRTGRRVRCTRGGPTATILRFQTPRCSAEFGGMPRSFILAMDKPGDGETSRSIGRHPNSDGRRDVPHTMASCATLRACPRLDVD